MVKRRPAHEVHRPSEMAAVVFPIRQEILDVLAGMKRASVAEIAETLGAAPDSLYYHVKALVRCGLVLRAGERGEGRRREALFQTVSANMRLRYEPSSPANVRGVGKIVGSMLRLAHRDFRRSLSAGDARVAGSSRELWAWRATGWLEPAELASLNTKIRALNREASRPRGGGRLYAVTLVLVPLDRRRRKEKRRAKSTK